MKKINSFIFPLFLSFAILFTLNDVYASSTLTVGSRVDITVSVTKANIHYQLVRKTGEDFLDNIHLIFNIFFHLSFYNFLNVSLA